MSGLTDTQRTVYQRDGALFPLPLLDAEELRYYRAAFDELEQHMGGKAHPNQLKQMHLYYPWAYELATHPRLLDALESLLGPDIMIHGSAMFCKYPHDPGFVSWHQDGHYWGLSQPKLTSAWIALEDSTVENGCLRVVLGSHSDYHPHHEVFHKDNLLTSGLTLNQTVDESQVREVELRAGEASLHDLNMVHGSHPNQTDGKRIGFAIRYTDPVVSQELYHHPVMLARGEDRYHNYDFQQEIPTGDLETCIRRQEAGQKQFLENRRKSLDRINVHG